MVHSTETSISDPPLLFTPLKIGNITLKNRIVISPMCQYSCEDGFVTDWHLVHLGSRAIGGAGAIIMEATAVEERGRISAGCAGIWKDEHIEPMKRVTDFIKSQGAVPGIQLSHSGRKGSTYPPWVEYGKALPIEEGGWQTVAPSAIAFGGNNPQVPLEATLCDIRGFVQSFVDAAKRSVAAGFELIELQFAHGYLVQTFLSPFSNKRTDQYGGDFEGRIRLALEIVHGIKEVLPEGFPLFVRISASDNLQEGYGWELKDSIELAKRFKELGVDLVDCSSGLNSVEAKHVFLHNAIDQVKMAEIIQRESGLATGAVGGIVSAKWAEKILQKNKATLISIARLSLDDPNWPIHAAIELNASDHVVPLQYAWAIGSGTHKYWRETTLKDANSVQLEADD